MFRGSHITRVDEKGRLKLPADFKRQIDEEYGGQFYITSRDGKTAVPTSSLAKQKLLKWINYFGQQSEMDGQGRVLLPQTLREKAKLMAEVVVYGNETHLMVSNHEDYEQDLASNPMTMTDSAELEKYGV